jgi:tetratricopeptide (TPR) repeat protein
MIMNTTRANRFLVDEAVESLKRGEVWALYKFWSLYNKLDKEPKGEDRFWYSNMLYHFGIALEKYKHHEQALRVFSECVSKFGSDSDADTAYLVSQSALSAAIVLGRASRFTEAIQQLDGCITRLQSASSIDDRRTLARAMLERATVLKLSGALEEAVTAYDELYTRFQHDDDPEVCRKTASALQEALLLQNVSANDRVPKEPSTSQQARHLIEIGASQLQGGQISEALKQFGEAVELMGEEPQGEDRIWWAQALSNSANALQRAGLYDEAVKGFEMVISPFQNSSEVELRKLARSALLNAGVASGAAQKFDQAITYFDAAIKDLEHATSMGERRTLANAMYNRATMLRQARRTEEAAKAFTATLERFEEDDDPQVCRFVGMAVYNKANAFSEAGEHKRAIEEFRSAFNYCGKSPDPVVRERAARALFNLSGEYLALERRNEWLATLEEFVLRCGPAPEPAIQTLVGQAIEMYPPLLTRLPAASHTMRSEYHAQSYIGILDEFNQHPELSDRWDLLEKAAAEQTESLEVLNAAAAESHEKAAKVLERYWVAQEPFGLFLRNFASEAWDVALPSEGSDFPIRGGYAVPIERVEQGILAAVGSQLPIISIINPSPVTMSERTIPKLELRNEIWEIAVKTLIRSAAVILLKLDQLTQGVLTEVQAILDEGRQASTVVIVATSMKDHEVVAKLRGAQLAGGADPHDPAIPRFAVVIDDSELPSEGGEPLAEIAALLKRQN